MDKLYNEREAANLIGLRPATLQRWRAERRHISFTKIGGRVMYPEAELQKFIERRTVAVV